MSISSSARRLVPIAAALALALSLAACGSNASASGNGGNTDADMGSAPRMSNVQMSGAVSGTIKAAGTCTKSSDQNQVVITDTVGGKLYLMSLVVTHYKGPGTYTTGTTEGEPVVNVNDESASGNWVSQYSDKPGTIVVNAGETSGTVDATLVNDSDHSMVSVTGTWSCQ